MCLCVALFGCFSILFEVFTWATQKKAPPTPEVRESVKTTQDGIYNRLEIGGECYLSDGHWCIPCDGGQALNCDEVRELTQDGEDN
jgi:hypothetical protein